ncbi:hypothetical protein Dimus_039353 [Dionaea muscipula]
MQLVEEFEISRWSCVKFSKMCRHEWPETPEHEEPRLSCFYAKTSSDCSERIIAGTSFEAFDGAEHILS